MAERKMHPGFARNTKVIAIILAVSVAAVVATLVALHNKRGAEPDANIPPMTAKGGSKVHESPRYTDSLNQANREGLAQAQKAGAAFIPVLSDNNAKIESALDHRTEQAAQAQPQKIDYQHAPAGNEGQQPQQLPPLPAPSQGLGPQVQQLLTTWDNPPNSQEVLGIQKEAQAQTSSGGTTGAQASTGVAVATPIQKPVIVHANDRYYAHTENAINTDAPSDALAMIDQGPCKGGELRGTGKLTGDVVTASYSVLTCNGKTYSVSAEALNPDTLSNALPADIDHHVLSHVAVPALLGALGAAGSVYSNAGASVTQNALGGTTVVQNPKPSPTQLEGAAVSGGVNGVQGVIQRVESATPAVTGTVAMNQAIIVLFKADVAAQ